MALTEVERALLDLELAERRLKKLQREYKAKLDATLQEGESRRAKRRKQIEEYWDVPIPDDPAIYINPAEVGRTARQLVLVAIKKDLVPSADIQAAALSIAEGERNQALSDAQDKVGLTAARQEVEAKRTVLESLMSP